MTIIPTPTLPKAIILTEIDFDADVVIWTGPTFTFYPGTECAVTDEPDPAEARKAETERLWALVVQAARG